MPVWMRGEAIAYSTCATSVVWACRGTLTVHLLLFCLCALQEFRVTPTEGVVGVGKEAIVSLTFTAIKEVVLSASMTLSYGDVEGGLETSRVTKLKVRNHHPPWPGVRTCSPSLSMDARVTYVEGDACPPNLRRM